MSGILDLSSYSVDDLTAIIDQATSLKASKVKESEEGARNGTKPGSATLVAPTPPQGKD